MATEPQDKTPRRYHRVGKYQVLSHVAAGGMGVVYKALDQETGREVALKILSPTLASRPTSVERFRREARQGAKLRHDHIVAVYEFGEANGTFYLAQEFVEGIDLHEYIRRKEKLSPARAVAFLLQAARALDWLHQNEIVHRDIKPSNFLVTEVFGRKVLKLTDLGVARELSEDDNRLTNAGSTVGTIDYMAPEQARDSGQADVRSDIYSLGCTFYHMLAGHPPFPDGGLTERLYQHSEAEPPDVRQFNPKAPFAIVMVLRRMLAKKPEDRYQTPAELIRDLSRLHRDGATGSAPTPKPSSAKTPSPDGTAIQSPVEPTPASPIAREPKSAERSVTRLPELTPEQRRIAVQQYERAIQVIEKGNFDYGIHLLLSCCSLDPANLVYRQTLRRFERANVQQSTGRRPVAWLKSLVNRGRIRLARRRRDYRKMIQYGELVLVTKPADRRVHLQMAEAAEKLGLLDVAIWLLEQIWDKRSSITTLNRTLARLYERRGDFMKASILWDLVRRASPDDQEARHKMQDLAAKDTIARGQYVAAIQETDDD